MDAAPPDPAAEPVAVYDAAGAVLGEAPRGEVYARSLWHGGGGVLLRRVGHYLVTTPANFGKLVDALGGIQVQTEAPFTFDGHRIEPDTITMKGAMAVAYLSQAGDNDVTGRWEDLLAGVLDAAHESSAWGTVGDSDNPIVVSSLRTAGRQPEQPVGVVSWDGEEGADRGVFRPRTTAATSRRPDSS